MAIVTPSAKSHELVNCRWVREIKVETPRDWTIYYVKVAVGSPIPWLMMAYMICAFTSRAGVEIAAWATAVLTLVYLAADRVSRSREFKLFRVGGDFFLLGYLLSALAAGLTSPESNSLIDALGTVRWVALFYLMTYCWELFPGLNRLFQLMIFSSVAAASYGAWQHFTGVNLLDSSPLQVVPITDRVVFIPTSFFSTAEILGTLLAMALPFPAAVYLFSDRRDPLLQRISAFVIFLLLLSVNLWTLMPGMWIAALISLVTVVVMVPRQKTWRALRLSLGALVVSLLLMFLSFGSSDALSTSIEQKEALRSSQQRAQINTQVDIWQHNLWIGDGSRVKASENYDPGTCNIYFQILATSGLFGLGFYFLFLLGFLLSTYRIFKEIPSTHTWHRVFIASTLASQIAFHVAGLYWSTLSEGIAVNLFVMIISSVSYLTEHYSRGLVSDDFSL